MNISIIIPAYNEEAFIEKTLLSLLEQSYPPHQIVVVNDSSTDRTAEIVQDLSKTHPTLSCITKPSQSEHMPGSKVVQAFNYGLKHIKPDYDIICKFDADLIFPKNYLEVILKAYSHNPNLGMAGGFCYILKDNNWVLENLTNKDHIRGALKTYRKNCFKAIGGLKPAMGWDTVDELLAQYHNWEVITFPQLHVKHLKPTGNTYTKKAKYKQGEAFYRMRYGFLLTTIASLKLAILKRNFFYFIDYIIGFIKAFYKQKPFLINKKEGAFIRHLRWKKIKQKVF